MPLIEAFLALALTLLSLAMIATLIVELFHRLARTRSKNLKKMLEKFYETELKKMVKAKLKIDDVKWKEYKEDFFKKLITNPLIEEGKQAGRFKSCLKNLTSHKDLTSLSTEDLFKWLADTDIGEKIKKETKAEIDETVDSLS